MLTIQIKYCDIPSYLHAGGFYRNLDSDDPGGIIQIPADCFHPDGETAADLEEFRQLLRVMTFWILDDIPVGVLTFCDEHEVDVWEKSIVDLPEAVKKEVQRPFRKAYAKHKVVTFDVIVETGRWDLIVYAVGRAAKENVSVTSAAALYGNLRLLEYLHKEGFAWHIDTCMNAAKKGHLECLRFAHEKGCPWDVQVYICAAGNGHISFMQYALGKGLREWDAKVCRAAALGGHLSCLQFARENGCPWDCKTTKDAAEGGHTHCLLYALEHGCAVDEKACSRACRNGHLECVELLREVGVVWDADCAAQAAAYPDIACLRHLRDNGCVWDANTTNRAAHKGLVDTLKYAFAQGCPYHHAVVGAAAYSRDLDCLKYLVGEQLLSMDNEEDNVFLTSMLRCNMAGMQYLADQGCPYVGADLSNDATKWAEYDKMLRREKPEFVESVKYAVERGWVPCKNFIAYVVTRNEPCKQWLISEGFYTDA